ncbi:MAG TPA: nicotinate (nicotinamide) nucleotide adenylyltransferase [Thermoanaerobaculia bacterium]|nr:nicotinate (nicotinamide) nucleotide adenylyltransferase [Thermoanaerobaculia bacterium]
MKIAICGGTFDPFHRGHLDPVLSAREELAWERVLYVPAYKQPFKRDRDSASGSHRFAMAALATLDHDAMFVLPLELERGAVSYTVDTLEELRAAYVDDTLDWIIGDDNLAQLHEWKSIERIFALANFVVLARGAAEVPPALASRVVDAVKRPKCGAVVLAHNRAVPVSSTEIRRRIHAGEPIGDLVDPRVSRYIQHYGLYKEEHS